MKRTILCIVALFVLAIFVAFPGTSRVQAEGVELGAGMSQGDFALWLVKAIGAQSKLPPAATAEDAINFFTQLGVVPEGGWQKGEEMTVEALASLVEGDPAEGFDELVEKVRDYVQDIFEGKKLGVFRVLSATPSIPAVE